MVRITLLVTTLLLIIIYSHSWFTSMLVLTPMWLGLMLASIFWMLVYFVRWSKKQPQIAQGIAVYCMGLFLVGLIPAILIQLYMILISKNPQSINHTQICIQFYFAVCLVISSWISYRESYLGESVRLKPCTLKFFAIGLSLLMIPITIFRPNSGDFIGGNFVYFLYLGTPILITMLAVYLFYRSKVKYNNYFAIYGLILIVCATANWVTQTTMFIDYVMIEALATCILCFKMVKFFRHKNESVQLSEVGKKWVKPSFKHSIFHPSIIVFFAIMLFSFSLLLNAVYLPTKKAIEQIQMEQIDQQANDLVAQINYIVDQNKAIIQSIKKNSQTSQAKAVLLDLYKLSTRYYEQEKTLFDVRDGHLVAILSDELDGMKFPLIVDIPFDSMQFKSPLFIEIDNDKLYKLENNNWLHVTNINESDIAKGIENNNFKIVMLFDVVDWLGLIKIDFKLIILLLTIFVVVYFIIYYKYSSIINTIHYLALTIKESPDNSDDSEMPVNEKNELGELSRAIVEMQNKIKDREIILEKEVLVKNEISQQLSEYKNRSIKSSQAKSEFFATMSHEIRSPMNDVIEITKLLTKTKLNFKQKEFVSSIMQSSETLSMIINDILDISKIEAKTLHLNIKPLNLKLLIIQTIKIFQNDARIKHLELLVNFKHDFNFEFSGDELRIKQILSNLISNAIKFTNEGFVLIEASVNLDENQINIAIIDSGIGIDESKISTIFDHFTQKESSTTGRFCGVGLGLSISENLVSLMGGHIDVHSDTAGSEFKFSLPVMSRIPHYANRIWNEEKYILIVKSEDKGIDLYSQFLNNTNNRIDIYKNNCADKVIDWANLADDLLAMRGINYYDLIIVDFEYKKRTLNKFLNEVSVSGVLKGLPILVIKDDETDSEIIYKKYKIYSINKPVYQSKLISNSEKVFNKAKPDYLKSENNENEEEYINFSAKILLVEDTYLNQVIAEEFLLKFGMEVTVVENGEQAIEEYKKEEYDLILMDCLMPVLDGYDATKQIREIQIRSKADRIPIIALTANAIKESKELCIEAGMDDFLSKPFVESDLIEMLKKWMPKSYFENNKKISDIESVQNELLRDKIYSNSDLNINPMIIDKIKHFKQLMGPDKLNELLIKAVEEIPKYLYLLIESNRNVNIKDMIRAVHSLKSMSANFSFMKMSVYCQDLEIDLKNKSAKNIDKRIAELNNYCYELIRILQEMTQ